MKALYQSGVAAVAVALIASFVWLAACAGDDDGGDDGGGNGGGSSMPKADVNDPLSALVAVRFVSVPTGFPGGSAPATLPANTNIADYVKALVAHADANYNFSTNTWAGGSVPAGFVFPLAQGNSDSNRQIAGLTHDVPLKWLDPINDTQQWGANCDYNAFFGDDWNSAANGWTGGPEGVLGNAPQWSGSGDAGYLWTNFEYISGNPPTTTSAPTDSHLVLAKALQASGVLTNNVTSNVWTQADVDTYIRWYKRQIGGAYVRIQKDASGAWTVALSGQHNKRFDATSKTLTRITGYTLSGVETTDSGDTLPAGVIPGIAGDCSGGQSPWGTIFTAEENVQDYYGDLEACWNSSQRFTTGQGFDSGASINPPYAPSTSGEFSRSSVAGESHLRDGYGWAVEIDPERPASDYYNSVTTGGDGRGHRKMGAFGRFRWENVTFVTDTTGKLPNNQPIVMYGADDRRGGRIYKYVSNSNYVSTMNRAEVRALLDDGKLYVAHFTDLHNATGVTVGTTVSEGGETITRSSGDAGPPTAADPGNGVFIELSVNNTTQMAPNAGATIPANHSILNGGGTLPNSSVGAALQSNTYNGIGGFPNNDLVYAAAFTAAAKLGVRELNRPEDLEWNPFGWAGGTGTEPRLYIAFTNHNSRTCCDANGVLLDPADDHAASTSRNDNDGRVWVLSYGGANPATTNAFTFWEVIASNESASGGAGLQTSNPFDFADPDNLAIDKDGGVWFGTDGYFGSSDAVGPGRSDSIYYLDTNPAHTNSFGRPFRVIAAPSNAEATGPCFTPDMRTLFYGAQHPGEQPGPASTFPQPR